MITEVRLRLKRKSDAMQGDPTLTDLLLRPTPARLIKQVRGTHTALLGEARWQSAPIGRRDLETLRRKVPFIPNPVDEPLVLWGRGGVHREVRSAGALGFSIEDMVT